jgi:hypothetical protein
MEHIGLKVNIQFKIKLRGFKLKTAHSTVAIWDLT